MASSIDDAVAAAIANAKTTSAVSVAPVATTVNANTLKVNSDSAVA